MYALLKCSPDLVLKFFSYFVHRMNQKLFMGLFENLQVHSLDICVAFICFFRLLFLFHVPILYHQELSS